MPVLASNQRKTLEDACTKGRRAAEQAVGAALTSLAVTADRPPAHLSEDERRLRRGLRAKSRQLGDTGNKLDLLVAECAYEQWHRLLFARFLAENSLLIHPEYRAPVTIEDCEELAEALGEPDGWSVAARFAAEILPGIFRLDDPCFQLRLAPEGRLALERILAGLPTEVFAADDALGWVYQFWQKDKKEEVNASERKIGGADLGPVTQLFTENYMVRFLLENSLGAWWAARHPDSPLVRSFEYLRFREDRQPAAGTFQRWPERAAEVTVIDPCCGSGHFLVEAFSMLWQMRAEEEGLSPVDAQEAVLRDNLFGLELDPRCVQIAIFAVALHAWKAGEGWRELSVPNIACSGIQVKAPFGDWRAIAEGNSQIERALDRLYIAFREADTLGSLIDPRRTSEMADPAGMQASLDDVQWEALVPILRRALGQEANDPAAAVLGADAIGIARAADFLSHRYTLVITNPPFLSRGKQGDVLRSATERIAPDTAGDLAVTMPAAWMPRATTLALVTPQNWQEKSTYEDFRRRLLSTWSYRLFARCGNNVWQNQAGKQPFKIPTVLSVIEDCRPVEARLRFLDIGNGPIAEKPSLLKSLPILEVSQHGQAENPEARILGIEISPGTPLLGDIADCLQGTSTGDTPRYVMQFWELPAVRSPWRYWLSSSETQEPFDGRETIVRWDGGMGVVSEPGSAIRGEEGWGRGGISVTQMGNLSASLYCGERFDTNAAAIVPRRPNHTAALWCFATSQEFVATVRALVSSTQVTNGALALVPFDVDHWLNVASDRFPDGLPETASDDPKQWLFSGDPATSTTPIHVGVARLLGFRWPGQPEVDRLSEFGDQDGIVCLPSVAGEAPADVRLQQLLSAAFDSSWSPTMVRELLEATGTKKNLADWLRDDFFKQHCSLFGSRPFIWHIWDGQREGFAALVNYHCLDRKALEKLTYTYLGDWIERQRAEVRDDKAGAEARLAAASKLRRSLELILEGEPPFDIYVRWKSPAEQPIGWDPDVNDGVRLNVRPFVEAGVLRSPFNVHWRKDRGKNPDGSERLNDDHLTTAEKRAAQGERRV